MDSEMYKKLTEVGALIATKLDPVLLTKITDDDEDSLRVWQAEFDTIITTYVTDDMAREAIYVGIYEAVENK